MTPDRSCWACRWQNINSPTTFLGNCEYPAANNPERCKAIPPEWVDKGCKNWKEKDAKQ